MRELTKLASARSHVQVCDILLIVLMFAPWAFQGSAPSCGVLQIALGLLAYLGCLMSINSQPVSCSVSVLTFMTAVDVRLAETALTTVRNRHGQEAANELVHESLSLQHT